jgi:hypothetical protein
MRTDSFMITPKMTERRRFYLYCGRCFIAVLLIIASGPFMAEYVRAADFTITGSMSTPRYQHTATLLPDGKVLVAGGGNLLPPYTTFASAEVYDPATGLFSVTGSMSSPRDGHAATLLIDGSVLITGGYVADGYIFMDRAELYNSSLGVFSPVGGMLMLEKRRFHTATLLADGRVLVAGGAQARGPSSILNDTDELYNPVTQTFTLTSNNMITRRRSHTATRLPNGKVLIIGGDTGSATLNHPELFDPASNTFTASGSSMMTGRVYHTATMLSNGKALIAGGNNGSLVAPYLNTAELYDPATDTFTPTSGSMTVARGQHAATLLSSGKVLITGGVSNSSSLNSAELYDPETKTFSPINNNMTDYRYQQTATMLTSGQALLAGGGDGVQPYTDTAELFDPSAYQGQLVKVTSSPGTVYATLQGAYDAALENDELLARNIVFCGSDLVFDRGITIRLRGGLEGDFSTYDGYTTLSGFVKVISGTLKMENIIIK